MKTITLTKGFVALIDDADYDAVSAFSWHSQVRPHTVYAVRTLRKADGKQTKQYMHRFLLGLTDPTILADHRNHNGLDNTRANLRVCSVVESLRNRRKQKNGVTSQYRGVSLHKDSGMFQVFVNLHGRTRYVGKFKTELEAALAYDAVTREVYGEFALCNIPEKKIAFGRVLALQLAHEEIAA